MTNIVLLAICAVLIGFGIVIIAVSSGFFMSLLGAGTMASGGSAAYLILSLIEKDVRRIGQFCSGASLHFKTGRSQN